MAYPYDIRVKFFDIDVVGVGQNLVKFFDMECKKHDEPTT